MASELIWRRLSDAEKKAIEQKAKNTILEFGKTLEKLPKMQEAVVERNIFQREETQPWPQNSEFKKAILKNAPNKDSDCIIAEKGAWTQK